MIYGVRYCDGTMMRFFPSEKEALDFVAAQQFAASCYRVESYSDVEFANFMLSALSKIEAVFQAHRLGSMG